MLILPQQVAKGEGRKGGGADASAFHTLPGDLGTISEVTEAFSLQMRLSLCQASAPANAGPEIIAVATETPRLAVFLYLMTHE